MSHAWKELTFYKKKYLYYREPVKQEPLALAVGTVAVEEK